MNILEIKNLSLKISDEKILKNINFELKEKEIISIIGKSGSGKTMLSKMIMGLKNKNMQIEGEILFKDNNIFDFSEEDLRKYRGEGIGYITQNPLNVFLPFQKIKTTFLETYLSHKNISKSEVIELAKKNLKQVNLENAEEILNKYPFELSGGMLQRVMVAIIIGLDAKIIIADEVTSALDSYNRYETIKIFKELNKMGKSIILITHDYYLMKSISERCLVMENGEVIEKFNPKLKAELIKENSKFGAKLLETTIYKRKGS
ncbi:ABC transporter ATP-binding protein [Fusobacterium nucleatum]|uniref:ATP-binding cassette domain-containing protein n=1 Tax=Fusobacterium nucleatum TaxID=851 RepID=UPI0006CB529B|nr:nickel ABC transporter ATP-binding protein [Fusobacterium nucleatum subsp. nucleatum]